MDNINLPDIHTSKMLDVFVCNVNSRTGLDLKTAFGADRFDNTVYETSSGEMNVIARGTIGSLTVALGHFEQGYQMAKTKFMGRLTLISEAIAESPQVRQKNSQV